jgi:hypothetical protein
MPILEPDQTEFLDALSSASDIPEPLVFRLTEKPLADQGHQVDFMAKVESLSFAIRIEIMRCLIQRLQFLS